jgi:hypothetical protein
MNTPLDFSAPVLSRSVDLTDAQDSWLARSRTLGAPSFSPYRILAPDSFSGRRDRFPIVEKSA